MDIDRDELAAWLRLAYTPNLPPAAARALLAAFGSPEGVCAASTSARERVVEPAAAAALSEPPEQHAAWLGATWAWLNATDAAAPRRLLCLADPDYPATLLEVADPPLLLHAVGRIELLQAPSVAIVGSRNPTPQGLQNARDFAATLAANGLTVVSGLALGIDGAAHEGALGQPGSTIAVLGTGIDRIYPRQHHALAHRIAAEGLLLSECPLAAPPLQHHFPRRNRLIAGLSRGTLVVEAAIASGSLITARLALECGREVLAIPGSIHNPLARGCHALIRQGARLVESAQDVLEELRWGSAAIAPVSDTSAESQTTDPLLELLGHDPLTLDELAGRSGVDPGTLNVRLLELELEGRVARLPGQRFQRLARA